MLAVVPNATSSGSAFTTAAGAAPDAVVPAPARAAASLLPAAAKPAAESPFSDEDLADVELSFFEGWSASAPDVSASVVAEPTDDVDSLLLTPEQQQRRQWFRRQVTALVAGMGVFGAVAIAMRIASLL